MLTLNTRFCNVSSFIAFSAVGSIVPGFFIWLLISSIKLTSSIIWAPSEQNNVLEIERVQKRFISFLRENAYYPFLNPS